VNIQIKFLRANVWQIYKDGERLKCGDSFTKKDAVKFAESYFKVKIKEKKKNES
jgi:hypothetical protein